MIYLHFGKMSILVNLGIQIEISVLGENDMECGRKSHSEKEIFQHNK